MQQISGERLQDHWSSGIIVLTIQERKFPLLLQLQHMKTHSKEIQFLQIVPSSSGDNAIPGPNVIKLFVLSSADHKI